MVLKIENRGWTRWPPTKLVKNHCWRTATLGWQIRATFQALALSQNLDPVFKRHNHRLGSLVTHLSHPEGDFINLVDGHKCLHIVKEEHIVEDGGKQGQRAVEHCSREDALPVAQDAPAHSSFSIALLRLFLMPSCNHLTAWPTQGHHLMIVCKNQMDKSSETWQKYS